MTPAATVSRGRVVLVPKGPLRVASSRYRVYEVARALGRLGFAPLVLTDGMTVRSKHRRVVNVLRTIVSLIRIRPDIIVLQRPGQRTEDALVAAISRALGAKVVIDFDDPMNWSHPATAWCLRLADVIVAGSETLREDLPASSRSPVRVLATPIPLALYHELSVETVRGEAPVVGWIGDGQSHAALLQRLVADLAGSPDLRDTTCRVRFTGVDAELFHDHPSIGGHIIECVPSIAWEDERVVAGAFAGLSVGLAPYRGRAGVAFKIIQYLAAGTLPLVDRRSPGVVHLKSLPEWLYAACITDYEDDRTWCRDLAHAIRLTTGEQRDQVAALTRRAARPFDVIEFARQLVA